MEKSGILLDTHIALWALTDDRRLSDAALRLLLSGDNEIYYSTVSVWEVTVKHSLHPEHLTVSGRDFMRFCKHAGYRNLPVLDAHVVLLDTLHRVEDAPRHKDPFDRILIAQAKAEDMLLMTHDALLPFYHEECVLFV